MSGSNLVELPAPLLKLWRIRLIAVVEYYQALA